MSRSPTLASTSFSEKAAVAADVLAIIRYSLEIIQMLAQVWMSRSRSPRRPVIRDTTDVPAQAQGHSNSVSVYQEPPTVHRRAQAGAVASNSSSSDEKEDGVGVVYYDDRR